MHKHAQDVAEAEARAISHEVPRHKAEGSPAQLCSALPCCQLVKRRSIPPPTIPHCVGVHVGWSEPSSKAELNMTERWQCNHVDHKAGQAQAAAAGGATGCNVILQLVCSSLLCSATCGICAAANRRIWLHTTKDQRQTACRWSSGGCPCPCPAKQQYIIAHRDPRGATRMFVHSCRCLGVRLGGA